MQRRWRAYHSVLPSTPGSSIELDEVESHHVRRVLRRRSGDRLCVFDGDGREWSGVIEEDAPRRVRVRLETELTDPIEAPIEIAIYQAICRADRMEWIIQKATELGVTAIHPLITERADAPVVTPTRLERWQRIAMEACKQSGRRRVPAIEPVEDLPAGESPAAAILLDTRAGVPPLGVLLDGRSAGAVWIAVGPESGFGEGETARWVDGGWRPAHLGPRTLRTETAGVVAATIVLHRWGDLR
jgi:16S rRNA (uracil1498-N3)-methyltransferase